MNKIKALLMFLAAPYVMLMYVSKHGIGKNSGHTAGLGEGVMLLFGIVSGAVQLLFAFLFLILLLIFCW